MDAQPKENKTSGSNSNEEENGRAHHGLIGLVNIGNSCYMNASLQALSNCPPFCRFFVECFPPNENDSLSGALNNVYRKVWISERNPGNLNPRLVSSRMHQRAFRGSAQQDAHEFIRCLLAQVHDELSVPVYQELKKIDTGRESPSPGHHPHEDQCTVSVESHSSCDSTGSMTKLMSNDVPPSAPKIRSNSLPTSTIHSTGTAIIHKKHSSSVSDTTGYTASAQSEGCTEMEVVPEDMNQSSVQPWSVDDTVIVNIVSGVASIHSEQLYTTNKQAVEVTQSKVKRSIVTDVFEGVLESSVQCLGCKHTSVTKELFQDLSLPIPGRKEIEADRHVVADSNGLSKPITVSAKVCQAWKTVVGWAHDMVIDPPTSLYDCLNVFFGVSHLTGDNRYYCDHCNSHQNSKKHLVVKKLPEILCVHLKRFRYDSFFATKINRFVEFPLSNLDLSRYCDRSEDESNSSCIYELVSMVTHYGGAGGGHYIAYCKNYKTGLWYQFNDSKVTRSSESSIQENEAYLLFYRKVSSNPVSRLNIADIIPPPSVEIPSQETAYISRYWLMLRNFCADPGPVLQYHYTCSHGELLPGTQDYAELLVLPIQKQIYNELVQRYGSGTDLKCMSSCHECHYQWELLMDRREKEKKEANKIQDDSKSSPKIYLLSNFWLKKWQQFINCKTLEINPPGPIENSCLLQSTNDNGIKFCTKALYRTISQEVWLYLYGIYGGGPHLTTEAPSDNLVVDV